MMDGRIFLQADGPVTVTAEYEGLVGTLESCTYPKNFSLYLPDSKSVAVRMSLRARGSDAIRFLGIGLLAGW